VTTDFLYQFIEKQKYGVLSTVSYENKPESAYVGYVVTLDLKLFIDTVSDSRKYRNLLLNSSISFVIVRENNITVQYEGIAKIPTDTDLDNYLAIYFDSFPEGKYRNENWNNIAYILIEPSWIRYSDFSKFTPLIEEIRF